MTSLAEQTLAAQLEQAGIPFVREYRFAAKEWCLEHGFLTPTGQAKRWRADFYLGAFMGSNTCLECGRPILVEIDGGGFVQGRHGRGVGMEGDAEKQSAAAILGFRVLRVTPRHVKNGKALEWIQAALGVGE
jgi:acetyl esterase/lipase